MTPDQWTEWLNLGLPTAALIAMVIAGYKVVRWLTAKVIEPLLGEDGAVHRYFRSQAEQYERQGDIADKHQKLTDELSKVCVQHHDRSEKFYDRTDINMADLLEIHKHIVSAMTHQFESAEAIGELTKADAIIRRHLQRDA